MAKQHGADEFEIIARYFRPLASGCPGALGLADDAALIEPTAGEVLVVTTDTLIAGVHFFERDPPRLIGQKLLRVNLSDLAAMGAKPKVYFLALALPAGFDEVWLAGFCEGLRDDQSEFAITLAGGDTTAIPGPVTLTVTALGEVPKNQALLRSGATAGDTIFVSGTIGDAALGLRVLRGEIGGIRGELRDFLISRYHVPQPRVTLGMALRGLAHAAIDVSDGLVGDLQHVCEASSVGADIEWPRVPLSDAARDVLAVDPEFRSVVLGGGDDYELLFTAAPESSAAIAAAGAKCGVPITAIGRIRKGDGVTVRDSNGGEIAVAAAGYRHF